MRAQTVVPSLLAERRLDRWSIVALNALIAVPLARGEVGSMLWGTGFQTGATIHEAGHLSEGIASS